MAIYQPSFCIPRNQSIDATNQDDMTFSFKLNGNNPLVAYNIQIFDNDTNERVYQLVSTENEEKIEEKIKEICNWINWQEQKQVRVKEAKEDFEKTTIKTDFRDALRKTINKHRPSLAKMESLVTKADKKRAGEKDENGNEIVITADDVQEYFRYWETFLIDLNKYIGDDENPQENTGEYLLQSIDSWTNIDPQRKDGIEYEKNNIVYMARKLVEWQALNKIKSQYKSLRLYYDDVDKARKNTSVADYTYVNKDTFNKAKQSLFLIFSEYANEAFFGKDLYEAVNSVWIRVDFDKLSDEIDNVYSKWLEEVKQEEYALAHLTGGYTKQQTNMYESPTESSSNVKQILKKGSEVAIITQNPQPPSGWYYISNNGVFGYVQSKDIELYNIENGKYYLAKPIYPTNYEGEQNTVYHQLPINILENGKSYKWSVTLYWSTSGKYNEDDKIDGSLVSVENYFDTRKIPVIGIKNYKEVFSFPSNYTTLVKDATMYVEDEDRNIVIKSGTSVRIIKLINDESASIEYVEEGTNKTYIGITPITNLADLGLYEEENDIMPLVLSKKATFVGSYEQEQFVSIAYFRWILYKLQYDTEEIVEVVKDTGMVPSADFQFFYEGFLNDEKYALKIFVQTLDNVEVETELVKFKASYLTYPIENMINAENSPIEHGIIVEWSNLRLIQGEVIGNAEYEHGLPVKGKTSLKLDKHSELIFDKDKGKPLSVDFDTNQILCTRFDEDRPTEVQRYYTASGLDDNGDVVSKTLELVPDENTQTTGKAILRYTVRTAKNTTTYEQIIFASSLYWYVIIMTSTGFTVFTKYAQGLFPALDQYPHLNKFTGNIGLYPDALTYLEEPSKRVEYNYQTIVDRDGNEI